MLNWSSLATRSGKNSVNQAEAIDFIASCSHLGRDLVE
jgi:hypothetical protein